MEKTKYYVSVQAGTVISDQSASSYELEIEATEEDIQKLHNLFQFQAEMDQASFFRAPLPTVPYHLDLVNDAIDENLVNIYSFLHQLGTEETKRHIDSMNIMN